MAKRASVDDRLSEIRALRGQEASPEVTAELRKALSDKSNLVVAAAAAIAGDQRQIELADALEAAFARFLVDPEKTDKLCRAKLAIVQALDAIEHMRSEVFHQAARHVQWEPVWGGKVDTAAPLRAAALLALARIDEADLLTLLVDSLTDPEKEVRIAAAQALGYQGSESATLLLRLKARVGDPEPDVLSECLSGLLSCAPKDSLELVSGFLHSGNPAIVEAALLALGRSRLPEALEPLKGYWQRQPLPGVREIVSARHLDVTPSGGTRISDRPARDRPRTGCDRCPVRTRDPRTRPKAAGTNQTIDRSKKDPRSDGPV